MTLRPGVALTRGRTDHSGSYTSSTRLHQKRQSNPMLSMTAMMASTSLSDTTPRRKGDENSAPGSTQKNVRRTRKTVETHASLHEDTIKTKPRATMTDAPSRPITKTNAMPLRRQRSDVGNMPLQELTNIGRNASRPSRADSNKTGPCEPLPHPSQRLSSTSSLSLSALQKQHRYQHEQEKYQKQIQHPNARGSMEVYRQPNVYATKASSTQASIKRQPTSPNTIRPTPPQTAASVSRTFSGVRAGKGTTFTAVPEQKTNNITRQEPKTSAQAKSSSATVAIVLTQRQHILGPTHKHSVAACSIQRTSIQKPTKNKEKMKQAVIRAQHDLKQGNAVELQQRQTGIQRKGPTQGPEKAHVQRCRVVIPPVMAMDESNQGAMEPDLAKGKRLSPMRADHDHYTKANMDLDEPLSTNDFDQNPVLVTEYQASIFAYKREMEIKLLPDSSYMDRQSELSWPYRVRLIEWLIQVHDRFELLQETLHLCVNYLDRFLSKATVPVDQFQLAGMVALLLASKFEEIQSPAIADLVFLGSGIYTPAIVRGAEIRMLKVLGYEMSAPGPLSFLRRISRADNYDVDIRTLAKYLIDITLCDHRFIEMRSSMIAAVGYCLSMKLLFRGEWNDEHEELSEYSEEDLLPGMQVLLTMLEKPEETHPVLVEKYGDERHLRASEYVQNLGQEQLQLIYSEIQHRGL